ncbi:MAG TPA: DUF6542 domain-containing protein [Pseudonocardia sp.]|jgi:hypothetical protein|nr:DUF6542 domain-containing protein [Pseudonocardia sp.]
MYERSILGGVLGLPGYAAIGIGLGFTGLGVFIDLNRINGLGAIFKGCYFAGCVLAICWVKRRALFGPMVQPPLLMAIAIPGVVFLTSGAAGADSGIADRLLSIGAPLLNGFPTMAVATAFTLAIGIARYVMQRPTATPPPAPRQPRPPRPPSPPRPPRPGEPVSRPPAPGRPPRQPTGGPPPGERPEGRQRARPENLDDGPAGAAPAGLDGEPGQRRPRSRSRSGDPDSTRRSQGRSSSARAEQSRARSGGSAAASRRARPPAAERPARPGREIDE